MRATDVAAIERCHEAFARGDTTTIANAQRSDVEWVIPMSLPYGGVYHGREGVLAFYAALTDTWSEYRIDLERVVGADDVVLSFGTFRGRGERSLEAPFVIVWEFEGGAVSECANTRTPQQCSTHSEWGKGTRDGRDACWSAARW